MDSDEVVILVVDAAVLRDLITWANTLELSEEDKWALIRHILEEHYQ